jgi:UDP-glucose 4-epimerase
MRPMASHLVNVAAEAAVGRREVVHVFGSDYPTPDGTCVRDYIHIEDVVDAHVLALRALQAGERSAVLNVGYGQPYSVLEVIEEMKRISGVPFRVEIGERRPGDPPYLAADPRLIKEMLGWKPRFDSLETICRTQFLWEKKRQSLTI